MARYITYNKNINTPQLADQFIEEIVKYYSVPISIIIDRGSLFTSN